MGIGFESELQKQKARKALKDYLDKKPLLNDNDFKSAFNTRIEQIKQKFEEYCLFHNVECCITNSHHRTLLRIEADGLTPNMFSYIIISELLCEREREIEYHKLTKFCLELRTSVNYKLYTGFYEYLIEKYN